MSNNRKKPLVSVLMNCYNSSRYLNQAIDSVINQTYKNWEIIFWDNQSTDKSSVIFKSYDDKRLKYYYSPNHTSLGLARNKALKKASGQFCAILDCDDLWHPKKLEIQLSSKKIDENVGVIYSDYNIITTTGKIKFNSSKRNIFEEGYVFDSILTEKITACWPTVIFNIKLLNKVGSFNDYKYLEDFDVLLRISENYKFIYINEKLASYRVHSEQCSTNYKEMLKEKFIIHKYWIEKWSKISSLSNNKFKLIKNAKSKAYSIAGINAIFNGHPSSTLFFKSLIQKITLTSLFYLIISFLGSKISSLIILKLRKALGYKEYF